MRIAPALVWCALVSAGDARAQVALARSNVLLIVVDDVGLDKIGAFTPTAPPTPNIDALAASGVCFTNAWAAPLCSPSRAAIHTGRYGFRTGVRSIVLPTSGRWSLPLKETTLPELFDGPLPTPYYTALIGKWHLDNKFAGPVWGPVAHGWDAFAGNLGKSVRNYCDWILSVATEAYPTPRSRRVHTYATTRAVDDAVGWIGSVQATGAPWMCCVAFQAPHYPVHEPPAHLHTRVLPPGLPCSNIGPAAAQVYFDAMVEALDTELGRLLSTLSNMRALDNTHIIFVSDNGTPTCNLGPPFVAGHGKGTAHQGGVQVPMIIGGPGVVRPGREVHDMVHVVDIFRTVADLAGVAENIPHQVTIDSRSLVPYMLDRAPARTRPFVFTELATYLEGCGNGLPGVYHLGTVAVRNPLGHKLIRWWPNGPGGIQELLFDLSNDPFEQNPLPLVGPTYQSLMAALATMDCGSLCR